jgi:hypothetical protein
MSGLVSALYLSTFEGVFLFVSCCNECVSVDVFDGPVCGFYSIELELGMNTRPSSIGDCDHHLGYRRM